jgi:3-hydroxy-5-methyl-1-naphthoate 3-O-methyltransferase
MKNLNTLSSPSELLDLATAYQQSKVLFALVEFGIPTMLAEAPQTSVELAHRLQLHPRAADRLLHAGVALGLLQIEGIRFRNAPLAEEFLVQNCATYLGEQLLSYDRVTYPLWTELTKKVREWQPAIKDDEIPQEEDQGAESLGALHNYAVLTGRALGRAYDFSPHQSLLDLGGGTGAMSIGICAQYPRLRALVYDLPQITTAAQQFITEAGLAKQITTQAGNFKEDELPDGFDVVLLANFLSVASEETNRTLFQKLYDRLPVGGAIVLSGWILDDNRTSPLLAVLFCLEDINWGAPDVERTATTYESWLREAGFVDVTRANYYEPTSMIVGRKS